MNNLCKKASDREWIYINNIPYKFLNFRGNAANLRIGNSRQLVFIPRSYFTEDGYLKDNMDLSWWYNKPANLHKVQLYLKEMEENK